MNLKEEILYEHSKAQATRLAAYIGDDVEKFAELMDLVLGEDEKLSQRAAWVMSHCADTVPKLIVPHIGAMMTVFETTPHVAVRRNITRVLQLVDIPEIHQGKLVNICFDVLLNPKAANAVRVFSMSILYNITLQQPELRDELRIVIEDMLPHGTPAIKSRGKRILKAMNKRK